MKSNFNFSLKINLKLFAIIFLQAAFIKINSIKIRQNKIENLLNQKYLDQSDYVIPTYTPILSSPLGYDYDDHKTVTEPHTITGNKFYYNGAEKLNSITIECEKYSESDCYSSSSCGWCKVPGLCVKGTPSGPLIPSGCSMNNFLFKKDDPNWNNFLSGKQLNALNAKPGINLVSLDKKGNSMLIKTATPDMSKVYVDDTYM